MAQCQKTYNFWTSGNNRNTALDESLDEKYLSVNFHSSLHSCMTGDAWQT